MNSNRKERELASFGRQILIISWKNLLLLGQNKLGLLCEIVFSSLFTLVFVALVHFSTPTHVTPSNQPPQEIISSFLSQLNMLSFSPTTTVFYHPDNEMIQRIADNAVNLITSKNSGLRLNVTGVNVSSGEELSPEQRESLYAMISFPSNYTNRQSITGSIQYSIYTKETGKSQSYHTDKIFEPKSRYLYDNSPEYYCQSISSLYLSKYSVFNSIKYAVDLSLIGELAQVGFEPSQIKIKSFDCPGYLNDMLKSLLSFLTPVLISLSFLVTFLLTVASIIQEKESKMKEYLKLIGVKPEVIWICWMARSFIVYLLLSAIITIASTWQLKSKSLGLPKALFLYTDPIIIFITCIVYSIQVTSLSLLFGQAFSRGFLAKAVSIIFWLATLMNFYSSLSTSALKYLFSIFPNSGLLFAVQVIFQFERSGKHLSFDMLFSNIYHDPLNLGGILAMMLTWSAFYLILSWYLEKVFPGDYGVKLPFYFIFMPSYWKSSTYKTYPLRENDTQMDNFSSEYFESEPSDLYASVKIRNLTKKFRSGFEEKTAVNNISLKFYENQITGFLGYNGAGKTTTTFILCGLYPPTSGSVEIYDQDIGLHMSRVRSLIGYCPQDNILFDELTVEQHLKLVCQVKGMFGKEMKDEVARISEYVGLKQDLKKKSRELSGGMKRRLSVGMAFIGDSKIIILDEPTSGLDPLNRRGLWELVRRYKQGRTIILTTHHLDEADALSDRIAVMNNGRVKCCGTPVYLKSKFGSGYRLTLTKSPVFDFDRLESLVKSITGQDPIVQSNVARELCITLPNEINSHMHSLLSRIEDSRDQIGIVDYGISSSTVEEVFLNIGGNLNVDDDKGRFQDNQSSHDVFKSLIEDCRKSRRAVLYAQQIKSLFIKRVHIFFRRYMIAIFTLLLPAVVQLVLSKHIPSTSMMLSDVISSLFQINSIPSNNLSITNYGQHVIPVSIKAKNSEIDPIEYWKAKNRDGRINYVRVNDTSINSYVYKKRVESLNDLINDYFVGFSLELDGETRNMRGLIHYSTLAYHTSSSALSEMTSFLLAYQTNNSHRSISTINSPINALDNVTSNLSFDSLQVLSCIEAMPFSYIDFVDSIIVAFMISITVFHLARERRNGSKFLQLLSGTHYLIYWLANLLFDMMVFFFNISLLTIILRLVSYSITDQANDTLLLAHKNSILFDYFLFLFLSSFSWATLTYLWTFLFKSDIISFLVLFLLLGFASFFDMMFVFIQFVRSGMNSLAQASGRDHATGGDFFDVIRVVFAILFPNVTVKRAIYNLKLQNLDVCIIPLNLIFKSGLDSSSKSFDINEPGIGKFLIYNMVFLISSIIILILLEENFFIKIRQYIGSILLRTKSTSDEQNEIEDDVKAEQDRINYSDQFLSFRAAEEPILFSGVHKMYRKDGKSFYAVNNLTFGESPTECFGLLGLNGAGKTTTLQMLTGETSPTHGEIFLNGHNVRKDRRKAIKNLGFCPQFDYLPEFLTVSQTLNLFANIRGIEPSIVNKCVRNYLIAFDLMECKHRLVQNLSGGNKRKVSSAIAFIGQPTTVILDEPTSGMDASARRRLLNVIKHARDTGTTILLTTHSMDECEALCTKLAIMAQGQFQCFGNIQHLKAKYGQGYTLILKCGEDVEAQSDSDFEKMSVDQVISFIERNIPNSVLKERQQQTVFFQIDINQSSDMSIAKIFSLIENNKARLNIETYLLSQTTLEQIFLSLARKQTDQVHSNNNDSIINLKSLATNSFINNSFSRDSIHFENL